MRLLHTQQQQQQPATTPISSCVYSLMLLIYCVCACVHVLYPAIGAFYLVSVRACVRRRVTARKYTKIHKSKSLNCWSNAHAHSDRSVDHSRHSGAHRWISVHRIEFCQWIGTARVCVRTNCRDRAMWFRFNCTTRNKTTFATRSWMRSANNERENKTATEFDRPGGVLCASALVKWAEKVF